ncbi:MAG: acyl-CoA dehydrogenase family protein [Leptospiraceae bacterium]|nr:acyl-CoA dehydrogenase family protein [Leptospiraceae bacterium]
MMLANFKNFLLGIDKNIEKEKVYGLALSSLAQDKMFEVLETRDFVTFHQRLMELSKLPHGLGLGVSLMAQINIAGGVLFHCKDKSDTAKELFGKVINGDSTVSLGVSETGWKGRIRNIQTTLKQNGDDFLLEGSKAFFTNGGNSSHFIVIAKSESNEFKTVLVPKDSNIEITKFSLDFAIEATHAKITFHDTIVKRDQILPISYEEHALDFRFSEILSLNCLFSGYGRNLLKEIFTNNKDNLSERKNSELINLDTIFQFFQDRLILLSKLKDNVENLESFYPFGSETVKTYFYETLSEIHPKDSLIEKYPDLKLFEMDDPMLQMLRKRDREKRFDFLKNSFRK